MAAVVIGAATGAAAGVALAAGAVLLIPAPPAGST